MFILALIGMAMAKKDIPGKGTNTVCFPVTVCQPTHP
jgi:hypothetical protein